MELTSEEKFLSPAFEQLAEILNKDIEKRLSVVEKELKSLRGIVFRGLKKK